MQFYRLENAVDRELELVRPAPRYIDDMLAACQHPETWGDKNTAWTRKQLVEFVSRNPDGIETGDAMLGRCPGYYFWMRLRPDDKPAIPMAGTLSLRIADTEQIRMYSGHVGYGVFPPARGHHYAERAVRLIYPLARAHGMNYLWITCNPDNLPSRRTCERLGAELIEIVDIPKDNLLYQKGERQKCRYRLAI